MHIQRSAPIRAPPSAAHAARSARRLALLAVLAAASAAIRQPPKTTPGGDHAQERRALHHLTQTIVTIHLFPFVQIKLHFNRK